MCVSLCGSGQLVLQFDLYPSNSGPSTSLIASNIESEVAARRFQLTDLYGGIISTNCAEPVYPIYTWTGERVMPIYLIYSRTGERAMLIYPIYNWTGERAMPIYLIYSRTGERAIPSQSTPSTPGQVKGQCQSTPSTAGQVRELCQANLPHLYLDR